MNQPCIANRVVDVSDDDDGVGEEAVRVGEEDLVGDERQDSFGECRRDTREGRGRDDETRLELLLLLLLLPLPWDGDDIERGGDVFRAVSSSLQRSGQCSRQ